MRNLSLGKKLSVEDAYYAGYKDVKIEISPQAKKKIIKASNTLNNWLNEGRVMYGVTTSLGDLIHHLIPPKDSSELSKNIIYSHAAGVGSSFSEQTVRRMMVLRLNCFTKGYSGVSLKLVDLLKQMINKNIIPIVPIKGSVGASGDLAPLSHIALALMGQGKVRYKEKIVSSKEALKNENLKPIKLGPKEGLSMVNGTTAMTTVAVESLIEFEKSFLEKKIHPQDLKKAVTTELINMFSKVRNYFEKHRDILENMGKTFVVNSTN